MEPDNSHNTRSSCIKIGLIFIAVLIGIPWFLAYGFSACAYSYKHYDIPPEFENIILTLERDNKQPGGYQIKQIKPHTNMCAFGLWENTYLKNDSRRRVDFLKGSTFALHAIIEERQNNILGETFASNLEFVLLRDMKTDQIIILSTWAFDDDLFSYTNPYVGKSYFTDRTIEGIMEN